MIKDKIILLLRGLPGSGKSTLAKFLSEDGNYPVLSIDDYFTDSLTGNYEFDYKLNHLAYKNCEEQAKLYAKTNINKIIIHNTFTMDWEMEPYFKIANENQYSIVVATVENYHNSKNIHEISDDQIIKMSMKYKVKLY